MRYLLVKPHVTLRTVRRLMDGFIRLEPLDLQTVAAGIEPRHEVRILDLTATRRPESDFDSALRTMRPDVIGLTGFSNQAVTVRALAGRARRLAPQARILVGGVHATLVPHDFHCPDAIDLIVRGEGATAMRRLSPVLEGGGPWPEDAAFVPVRSPRFGELVQLPPPEPPEFSEVPWPRRELVDRSRYFCVWSGPSTEDGPVYPRVAAIRTSYGCPYRCNFCSSHLLARGKYRQRDPEDVVREIASLSEEHVYFVDDELFVNARRLETVARLLIERGIRKKYWCWVRSDTICRSVELLRLWKQAGLSMIGVGMESMEAGDLESYNKGCGPEVNQRVAGILRELGIGFRAAMIVNPDYGAEDFLRMRRAVQALLPAETAFTIWTPAPGTALWEQHRPTFRVSGDPYAYSDCIYALLPTRLPLKTFYRYYTMLWLYAFRGNPWRYRRVWPSWREIARVMFNGALIGWTTYRLYRDYDRSLW